MPHLHISIIGDVNVSGIDTPVKVPDIILPITDAEATAAALGLEAIDANGGTATADGGAEIKYQSPNMSVKVARIFHHDVTVEGSFEVDAKVSITND